MSSEEHRTSEEPDVPQVNVREIVWYILIEHERNGTYSNLLIRNAQDRYAWLPLPQRSFLKRLAEGTIERQIELDAVIAEHVRNPEISVRLSVRCLLRMSIYQIYYMDSVPDHAACDEAVRLCHRHHLQGQAGFVNGLLRAVCREQAAGPRKCTSSVQNGEPFSGLQEGRQPSAPRGTTARSKPPGAAVIIVKSREPAERDDAQLRVLEKQYSMPSAILQLWREQLGEERLESLCRAVMEVRPVCIRLDPRLGQRKKDEILYGLEKSGVRLTPGRWVRDCWYLEHVSRLSSLPGYAEGQWTVQDESSQLLAQAAGLEGRRSDVPGAADIYDPCAAPGGKTMLAAMLRPGGQVCAFDLTSGKTERIRSNLGRMHIGNVTVGEQDASLPHPERKDTADLVICDVPCSGLGVMTRKRDIKYGVTPQKLHSLVTLQKKIVRSAAQSVKPGGVMLYSTCTINRMENEKIADYIARSTDLKPETLEPYLPENFPGTEGARVQLFPDVHGTDGFFMARFRKPTQRKD